LRRVVLFFLIIFLPLFLLLQSVEFNTFDKELYIKSYERYGVLKSTNRSIGELDGITKLLLRYLREGLDKEVLRPFFSDREVKHMEDVKLLFKYGFMLKNISLILSIFGIVTIVYSKDYSYFAKGVFYGIFGWWGFFILLFIVSTWDFTKYFTYFHLIFFDNDLWILNPDTDLLIQMLPEQFFIHIFRRIVLLFLGMLAIIQLIAYILMRKERDDDGGTMGY